MLCESEKGHGAWPHGTQGAAQVNTCPPLWLASRVVDVRGAGCCVPLAVFGLTCGDREHTSYPRPHERFRSSGGSSRVSEVWGVRGTVLCCVAHRTAHTSHMYMSKVPCCLVSVRRARCTVIASVNPLDSIFRKTRILRVTQCDIPRYCKQCLVTRSVTMIQPSRKRAARGPSVP